MDFLFFLWLTTEFQEGVEEKEDGKFPWLIKVFFFTTNFQINDIPWKIPG